MEKELMGNYYSIRDAIIGYENAKSAYFKNEEMYENYCSALEDKKELSKSIRSLRREIGRKKLRTTVYRNMNTRDRYLLGLMKALISYEDAYKTIVELEQSFSREKYLENRKELLRKMSQSKLKYEQSFSSLHEHLISSATSYEWALQHMDFGFMRDREFNVKLALKS